MQIGSPADWSNPRWYLYHCGKPGEEIGFREFASDFLLFLKHCEIKSAAESDALAQTRTSFRKVSIAGAERGAPDAAIACFERAAAHGYGPDRERLGTLRKQRG